MPKHRDAPALESRGCARSLARGAAQRLGARALALTWALALAGCVVLPQTIQVYDPDCRVLTRQVVLQANVIGHFQACAGDGCLAMLTAAGVVTAASAVVSGSIALVGNAVYWLERQGRCQRGPPLAEAAAAVPPGTSASTPAR